MLRFILNPRDRWQADKDASVDFMQSLTDWENLVTDYTQQSGENVSDNVRVSTLLEHAPSPYLDILRQAAPDVRASYAAMRGHLRSFFNTDRSYSLPTVSLQSSPAGGAAPMQVDAVKGGKGN